MNRFLTWLASLPAIALCVSAAAADIDWSKVDQALGKKGSDLPGGVHKYGLPRSDLHVNLDGVAIKPALALGSWLAFQPSADGAMVMGHRRLSGSLFTAAVENSPRVGESALFEVAILEPEIVVTTVLRRLPGICPLPVDDAPGIFVGGHDVIPHAQRHKNVRAHVLRVARIRRDLGQRARRF